MNITRVLNQSTPMTTALAFALCAGAFWIGQQTSTLNLGVQQNKHDISEGLEWRKETQRLIRELSSVSQDNKRRLDLLESRGLK